MASYRVELARSARRDLERLDRKVNVRLVRALEDLAMEPRPPGVRKMADGTGYRLRVGDYRVIYDVNDRQRVVEVLYVRHHRDAYRTR
jgi:mRNA interferase RelE/StbE